MTPEDIARVQEGAAASASQAPARVREEASRLETRATGHRTTGLCFDCGQALAVALQSCMKTSWLGEIRMGDHLDPADSRKLFEEWPQCAACREVPLDRWETHDDPQLARGPRRFHCVACNTEARSAFEAKYVEPPGNPVAAVWESEVGVALAFNLVDDYSDAHDAWWEAWPYCDDCPPLIVEPEPTPSKKKRADDISEAVLSVLRDTGQRLTRSALIQMVGGLDKNNSRKIMDALVESGEVATKQEGTSKFYWLAEFEHVADE